MRKESEQEQKKGKEAPRRKKHHFFLFSLKSIIHAFTISVEKTKKNLLFSVFLCVIMMWETEEKKEREYSPKKVARKDILEKHQNSALLFRFSFSMITPEPKYCIVRNKYRICLLFAFSFSFLYESWVRLLSS